VCFGEVVEAALRSVEVVGLLRERERLEDKPLDLRIYLDFRRDDMENPRHVGLAAQAVEFEQVALRFLPEVERASVGVPEEDRQAALRQDAARFPDRLLRQLEDS